jgi:hypothetical protein
MLASLFAAVALFAQIQSVDHVKIWIEKNEVWAQSNGPPVQLTHRGQAKGTPVASPDNHRIVYLADQPAPDSGPTHEAIFEIDANGKALRTLVPASYVLGPFDKLEWIDNKRIGAMTCGRANCFYWVLDPDSGKTLKTMIGGFDFVWSHNAQWVARRFIKQSETAVWDLGGEDDTLQLNETQFYPPDAGVSGPRRNPTHWHVFGRFTWSPNDTWLSFTDTISPDGDSYVVLVSPAGKILRETVSTNVRYDATVDWVDDMHLQLTTGGRTFSFVVDGGRLLEVASK